MRTLKTVLFCLSILVFLVWVIIPVAFVSSGLRIADNDFRNWFNTTRIWILPLAVLFTLTKTLDRYDSTEEEGIKVGCTASIAICLLVGLFVTELASGCVYEPLLAQKGNVQHQIVIRSCGGGAHDSSPPLEALYERQLVYSWLERLQPTDTTKLDRNLWLRISQ